MKALQFRKSIPRYALLKAMSRRWGGPLSIRVSPLTLVEISEPRLPTPQWVRIRPRLSGICGSDLATLGAKGSPYLAPLTSMPFVMGHETVGTITELGEQVTDLTVGDRVVLHPALGCCARGIEPPCDSCLDHRDALCRNVTEGDVSAGIQTGFCRDTGGGFGESLVAHQSQVYRVSDEIEDQAAVLIEPFSCALHGALRAAPSKDDRVLVIGCGTIGLLTIAALRATGCESTIYAVAKHDHQRQYAAVFGADEFLDGGGSTQSRYNAWATALDAKVLDAPVGHPTVIGGADVTYDCVASSRTIDDGLRFTKSGGTYVLVGMPGVPKGVDWTPMWYKELNVRAAYAYGPERQGAETLDTFDMALELMKTWGQRLAPLVGPPYDLADFRAALAAAINTGRSGIVKTVFAIDEGTPTTNRQSV